MSTVRSSPVPLPGAFAPAVGFAGAVVATCVAILVGATRHPTWALVPLAAVVISVALVTTWTAGLVTAICCWAFDAGFILGREAHLAFTTSSALAAVVLAAAAGIAAGTGHLARAHRRGLSPASRRRTIQ